MKHLVLTVFSAFLIIAAFGQKKEGRVVYERTTQMQIRLSDNQSGLENMLPKSRTDRYELLFGNNQSLWRKTDDEVQDELAGGGAGGFQIRMIAAGVDDVTFHNFNASQRVDLRELGTKKYVVEDSLRRLNWKLTDETKNILGYNCRKAIAQRVGMRTMMSMENGKMERKEVSDTSNIVVWYASEFLTTAGPGDYQGQLPGLVLEVDVNNGRQLIKAVEVSSKVDLADIKVPKGGKKLTPDEFTKERNKMFEEMEKNGRGPGREIRIQQ
jgi:GLPGLI family protein